MTRFKREDYQRIDRETIEAGLSEIQKKVTLQNGTEPPFQNPYYNNTEEGLYVDLFSGEPLFTTREQFDAGCGWPSFTRPIQRTAIQEQLDRTHGMTRTEVRSSGSDVHLGHVFPDGPQDQGGLRYCINSAAMRFIPKGELAEAGYGDLLSLFEEESGR